MLAAQNRTEPQIDRARARRELELARKREGILMAAARAFARGGYHVTTMQDIAREAGYTPPSLYAYFTGKEQIFGELAALDWGSGFGYPRLATVAAASDVRLLRVPCDVLNELVRSNFELERAIDRVARERMRIIAK